MKFNLIILFAFLFCKIYAQPGDDFIPCHHAHQHALSRAEPTAQELLWIQNSNKRSDSIDILNYTIDIDVTNFAGKSIVANTTVRFKTKMDQIEWITLDLKNLQVDSITYHGSKIVFNYVNDIITAFFGSVLPKGHEDNITVFYRGVPSRDPVWGGFYFVDDIVYNLGIGLSTTPPNFGKVWFPCFDNFVERSTYDYYVTTTADKKAYCVGTFISEEMIGSNKIRRHYSMKNEIPTYLSSIAAANYAVHNDKHQGLINEIPIQLIAKPQDLNMMKTQFAKLPKAIEAFEYWFGPYRFERVGFVATTQGAMEHPTNVAYPISTIQSGTLSQNERLFAHEYGHHWWGDLTTLDDARDMWIKEGTAEYSAHLFVEYAYGKADFIDAVKSNLSNILFNAHKNDGKFLPLSPMPYENTYGTHTYRKGAAMIHNMRGYLGDEAYRKTCMMIFDSLTGKSMNAYEFRDFLNKYSGKDMTSYFDDYIFNKGYCTFYVDSFKVFDMNGQHYAYIQLKQKSYYADHLYNNVPLRISMYDNQLNRIEVQQNVSGESYGFTVLLPDKYTPVAFLVNEKQDLNFATLQSNSIIKKTGTPNIPFTSMVCNVSTVSDSAYVNIAHHLVAPDSERKMDYISKISSRHFWQVHIINHGDFHIDGRLEYNGLDSASIDSDILFKSEDSIMLVYRKDWTEPWREYTDYNLLKLSLTDRKGFVRITKLISGDYALAYGVNQPVATKEKNESFTKVYPNPVYDKLTIEAENKTQFKYIQILDVNAKLIKACSYEEQISVIDIQPGYYVLIVYDKEGRSVLHNSFIKK
jgi:aminopeptidase N